jgi:putative aminopeptidase FrvX
MHTTVETVAIKDVENVIELIYLTLKKIHPELSFKYLE